MLEQFYFILFSVFGSCPIILGEKQSLAPQPFSLLNKLVE
jgi:hypothetical protein